MERIITMSTKELDRTETLSKLKQKVITQTQAADTLGISTRQVRRLFRSYKKFGAQGLISKKRGKPSNHQLPEGRKEWTLALIREHYPDFGPTFAREKLFEVHKLRISIGSVRSLMIAEGLWVDTDGDSEGCLPQQGRGANGAGVMRADSSPHDWFEG